MPRKKKKDSSFGLRLVALSKVTQLPEKDQRAVIRLISSLAAVAAPRRNAGQGEYNGR